MFNFLHNFNPDPILLSIGPVHIYWYGFFIVLGIVSAIFVTAKIAHYFDVSGDTIIDLAFWLIICGLLGARIYHVLLELPYYLSHPVNILKVWQGGLAIHGAILAGIVVVWYYARKSRMNFFQLAGLITPGLALAQAIGRWGNYFNQELFGYPTNLPWGILIDQASRPLEFYNNSYFHPTFLYESFGNLIIFLILVTMIFLTNEKIRARFPRFSFGYFRAGKLPNDQISIITYLFLYSVLRFSLEFIRIDSTPEFWGLRLPQWISLGIIVACILWVLRKIKKDDNNK